MNLSRQSSRSSLRGSEQPGHLADPNFSAYTGPPRGARAPSPNYAFPLFDTQGPSRRSLPPMPGSIPFPSLENRQPTRPSSYFATGGRAPSTTGASIPRPGAPSPRSRPSRAPPCSGIPIMTARSPPPTIPLPPIPAYAQRTRTRGMSRSSSPVASVSTQPYRHPYAYPAASASDLSIRRSSSPSPFPYIPSQPQHRAPSPSTSSSYLRGYSRPSSPTSYSQPPRPSSRASSFVRNEPPSRFSIDSIQDTPNSRYWADDYVRPGSTPDPLGFVYNPTPPLSQEFLQRQREQELADFRPAGPNRRSSIGSAFQAFGRAATPDALAQGIQQAFRGAGQSLRSVSPSPGQWAHQRSMADFDRMIQKSKDRQEGGSGGTDGSGLTRRSSAASSTSRIGGWRNSMSFGRPLSRATSISRPVTPGGGK